MTELCFSVSHENELNLKNPEFRAVSTTIDGLEDCLRLSTTVRAENFLSDKQLEIIENKWSKSTDDMFDSEVLYLIMDAKGNNIIVLGSYKIFYGINEIICNGRENKMQILTPYVLGSHALICDSDGRIFLFKRTNGVIIIPGGVADINDVSCLGNIDMRTAALRETTEEIGEIKGIKKIDRCGIWYDNVRPHIFYTYKVTLSSNSIDYIFDKNVLMQEGIESYICISKNEISKYLGVMSRSARAACLSYLGFS